MSNSIENRLNRLNKKNEAKIARRLEIKLKSEKKARVRKPNQPNYLTSKQANEARKKFGIRCPCMICMKPAQLKKAHAIDHCHVTGSIRGILCYNCNIGIGYFKEDIEIMESALRYLKNNKLDPNLLTDEELERLRSIQNR